MQRLDGVEDARVNFGAAKITVFGAVSKEKVEEAGAFENLKLRELSERSSSRRPFWKQKQNIRLYLAALLLLISLAASYTLPADHVLPVFGYTASIIIGGWTLFQKGFKNLVQAKFDMNTLMTIAVIGAAIIGEWIEGAVVVILFAVSEALERYSMDKARQSISSLMDIAPDKALIKRNNEEMTVPTADIQIGDILIIKPGEKVAMDGSVTKGDSSINEAAITGESIPAAKTPGDEVYAGTLNEEGLLEAVVTKRVEDTTIAKIIHLVEEAQAEKAPSQAFVDQFAQYYTPFIIIIAFFTAMLPPLVMNAPWSEWVYLGLAVLVVGCPCALVISTPIAVVTAIGNAAKNGVLIKGGVHLETAGAISAAAFDKTGTLTEGVPVVTDIVSFNTNEKEMLSVLAAIEKGSQHPLASSIIKKADSLKINYHLWEIDNFQSLTGLGLQATVNGTIYYAGSPNLFKQLHGSLSRETEELISAKETEGNTVILLGDTHELQLIVSISDQIRDTAKRTLTELNNMGIKTIMLTGDNERTAKSIGSKAGVTDIRAGLLPESKLSYIKEYVNADKKVAMIGDGVNDAPALAAASVGIAMGGAGTDTALETADIALMADDLDKLPYTIKLSRKALKIIKQNITFSLAIKAAALLLVIPGWLTLWIAIAADMGATLLVTLNSLRLLKTKK
ncbi:Cd2+/Zn2+-exporting ATPase [Alkalicoccus daliensis]|uniref:Cd(2+)-exporting ATPase n=1 Tax=Alkalicoccus daliensis TaxID=745820 RepID=A0A1H0DRL4_9BACI|nr:Cd2+/Zn2+-exporting ATPase [Alkalicoccus daliensis]